MASYILWPNGIGGSTGSELATAAPLYASGDVWYVLSTSGSDAASPRGKERERPLATLAQAHTNAAAGDTIVLLSGHSETLTAAQTFNKAGLNVVGEGSGSTRPRFTRNGNVVMFDVTAAGVTFENIYFVASASASALSRLRTAAVTTVIKNCYFECGASDTGPATEYITGAGQATISDTFYVSTATVVTAQPDSAIKVTNAVTDIVLNDVTIDGDDFGWSNPFAFNGAAAITRLRANNINLLNNSDMTLATGTVTSYITVNNSSGSARIVWAA